MKGNLNNVLGGILLFSLASMIVILAGYIFIGAMNDYVLFELQEQSDDLENRSIIKANANQFLQETGDSFTSFNFRLDDLWFISYLAFVISSLYVAYRVEKKNYYSFLGGIFVVVMLLLFILGFITTITDWLNEEILLKLFPNVNLNLPKFYWYLDHVGLLSTLHFAVCFLINVLDFDLSGLFGRRKQEEKAIDEEIL